MADGRGGARGAVRPGEEGFAWRMVLPAVGVVLLVALFPLLWTGWESLHLHDLRMPWRGRPFVGLANYVELSGDARFWGALAHTLFFTGVTVALELALGMILALALDRTFRGRGAVRTVVLLPWAIPTVVSALIWRFVFEGRTGIANAVLVDVGLLDEPVVWFSRAATAWVPVILADVWKMTPFVTLLLLAGLQNVDPRLQEAARMDGAGPWRRFREVTLPLMKPAILVALVFRTLDAFRVFDLIWVLTGGGPGTATEPLSVYAFDVLLQHLRFGYGSAISLVVFAVSFVLALIYIRLLGSETLRGEAT